MNARELARPYVAAFASRFQLLLQYRSAAVAGVVTQCWWGGLKVMILAAFYGASADAASHAPITLAQAITYTWISQAALALLPWVGDPDIGLAVRTGAISYDRLRPLDIYGLWYARAAGWIAARAVPRAALMFLLAAVVLPLCGFGAWSWHLPVSATATVLSMISIVLAVLLSAAIVMLINVIITASMSDRGVNVLAAPLVIVFSGNLLPLPLLPDGVRTLMLVQPFAGLIDIPSRIYLGALSGDSAVAALGLQLFWIAALALIGRWAMERTMRTLEVQGG